VEKAISRHVIAILLCEGKGGRDVKPRLEAIGRPDEEDQSVPTIRSYQDAKTGKFADREILGLNIAWYEVAHLREHGVFVPVTPCRTRRRRSSSSAP
jgi:hypothetical protein